MISIRRCNDVDCAETLSALGGETFAETFGHLYKREDLELFIKEKHAPSCYRDLIESDVHAVWMAYDENEKPIGYAVAGPCNLPAPELQENAGELIRLYVLAAHRGGVGRLMLDQCLEWLEENFSALYLSVYKHNHGAQRLYQRYGFEKIHEYFFMVGNHADPEYIFKRT